MADSFNVRVEMSPTWEKDILSMRTVKGIVTKETNRIAAKANAMAIEVSKTWHIYGSKNETNPGNGTWKDHGQTFETRGGTKAVYKAGAAEVQPNGVAIGIVYTGNHAAQQDNLKHQTLLKAKG